MSTILLVDDSPTVLKVMSISLMAAGFVVRTAATGAAAMQAIQADRPDAVILDVMLPDTNGMDLLRRMKELPGFQEVPVLLLTGQDDYDHMEQGYGLGAAGFLPKHSTSPKVLVQKLKSLLGG